MILYLLNRLSDKSLMSIKNSNWRSTESQGIPTSTFSQKEICECNTALFFLSFENSDKVSSKLPKIPFCFNWQMRTWCQTLSNTFEISLNTALATSQELKYLYIPWVIAENWLILE